MLFNNNNNNNNDNNNDDDDDDKKEARSNSIQKSTLQNGIAKRVTHLKINYFLVDFHKSICICHCLLHLAGKVPQYLYQFLTFGFSLV